MKKQLLIPALALALLLSACAPSQASSPELSVPAQTAPVSAQTPEPRDSPAPLDIEPGIAEITQYGNIVLTISPASMTELGYEPADLVHIRIGGAEMDMPIGTSYSDVDSGAPICCFRYDPDGSGQVVLAINTGNMAAALGIAEQHPADEAPGYVWRYLEGYDESVPVSISMAQKQGYAEAYALHQIVFTRSNVRADYESLSDAEYANFRAVATTGMGKDTLFRSSSPLDPQLNRNVQADEALLLAAVRTVMNMTDSEAGMTQYAGYASSYYSKCDVIALNMSLAFFTEDFQKKLAQGFRYLASHEGPYLIHCTAGQDRTGFASAMLECLMGASAQEVVSDYMVTYYNYFGVEPGTPKYDQIAAGNIETSLARAFGIASIRDESTDLQACAQRYLTGIGMTAEEIAALRENLGRDYGGLGD